MVTSVLTGAVVPPDYLHTKNTMPKHSISIILHDAMRVNYFFHFFSFFASRPAAVHAALLRAQDLYVSVHPLSAQAVQTRKQLLQARHNRMPAGIALRRNRLQASLFCFFKDCVNCLLLCQLTVLRI